MIQSRHEMSIYYITIHKTKFFESLVVWLLYCVYSQYSDHGISDLIRVELIRWCFIMVWFVYFHAYILCVCKFCWPSRFVLCFSCAVVCFVVLIFLKVCVCMIIRIVPQATEIQNTKTQNEKKNTKKQSLHCLFSCVNFFDLYI